MNSYPVAGGQYFWTYHFAPPKVRVFLSYLQGLFKDEIALNLQKH